MKENREELLKEWYTLHISKLPLINKLTFDRELTNEQKQILKHNLSYLRLQIEFTKFKIDSY